MLQEINQNVWDIADNKSIICILTNNSIVNGKNVMGAGIATGAVLFRFPTKNDVWYNSNLNVIENSLRELIYTARLNKNYKIYLPRPGCGCGGLDWESQVKPLCEKYLNDSKNIFIVSK